MIKMAVLTKGKGKDPKKVQGYPNRWSTSSWLCAPERMKHLIGGFVSCHDLQKEVSRHQGVIVDVISDGLDKNGCHRVTVVYDYVPTPVKGSALNWGARAAVHYYDELETV